MKRCRHGVGASFLLRVAEVRDGLLEWQGRWGVRFRRMSTTQLGQIDDKARRETPAAK